MTGKSFRKKKTFIELKHPPLTYHALKDPSLSFYFSKPLVQKHLMENGWFAANAECSICNSKDKGDIRLCTTCKSFFHVNCLQPSPMTKSNIKVLILHFLPLHSDISIVKNMISKSDAFSLVQDFNLRTKRITLAELCIYDSVLVFAYQDERASKRWKEPDYLGDLLSDYVSLRKGGLVLGPLTHALALGGKWRRNKLSPLLPGRLLKKQNLTLGKVEMQNHPILHNISSFQGGETSTHISGAVSESGGNTVVRWSNGLPLVVVLDDHATIERGRIISLNFIPSPKLSQKQSDSYFWDPLGDGGQLIQNALRFAAEPTYQKTGGMFTCESCVDNHQQETPLKSVYKKSETILKKQNYKSKPKIFIGENRPSAEDYDQMLDELQQLKQMFRNKFRQEIDASSNKKYSVLSTFEKENQCHKTPANVTIIPKVIKEKQKPTPIQISLNWKDRALRASQVPSSTKPDSVSPISLKGADLNDEYAYDGTINPKRDPTRDFDIISSNLTTPILDTPSATMPIPATPSEVTANQATPSQAKTIPMKTIPKTISKKPLEMRKRDPIVLKTKIPISVKSIKVVVSPSKQLPVKDFSSVPKGLPQSKEVKQVKVKPKELQVKSKVSVKPISYQGQTKPKVNPNQVKSKVNETTILNQGHNIIEKQKTRKIIPISTPQPEPLEQPQQPQQHKEIIKETTKQETTTVIEKTKTVQQVQKPESPIKGFFNSFIPKLKKEIVTKKPGLISKSSLEIHKSTTISSTVKSLSLTALNKNKTIKKVDGHAQTPSIEALKKNKTKSSKSINSTTINKSDNTKNVNGNTLPSKVKNSKSPLPIKKVYNPHKKTPIVSISKSMDSIIADKKKLNPLPVKKTKSTTLTAGKSPLMPKKFVKSNSNESKSVSSKLLKSGSTRKSVRSIDVKKSSMASFVK